MRFLASSLLLLLTGCHDYPKQYEQFCTIAAEIEPNTALTGDEKTTIWGGRAAEVASGDAAVVLSSIAAKSVEGEQKYSILKQGAKELGIPNWECSPLKKIFDQRDREVAPGE